MTPAIASLPDTRTPPRSSPRSGPGWRPGSHAFRGNPCRPRTPAIPSHWPGPIRFLDDGTLGLGTNPVGNRIRPIALTRKNTRFAGNEIGAGNRAMLASLVATCKLSGLNPADDLADTLRAILDGHPRTRIEDLMPRRNAQPSSLAASGHIVAQTLNRETFGSFAGGLATELSGGIDGILNWAGLPGTPDYAASSALHPTEASDVPAVFSFLNRKL